MYFSISRKQLIKIPSEAVSICNKYGYHYIFMPFIKIITLYYQLVKNIQEM